jgi:hypothetical protein
MNTLPKKERIPVFVDMDGVVANFKEGVIRIAGSPYVSSVDFWKQSLDGSNLFLDLHKMSRADDLINGLLALQDDLEVQFLTAIPYFSQRKPDEWAQQKKDWIKKDLPQACGLPFWLGPYSQDKWAHCLESHYILIDDSELNCKDWETKGGGVAFLYKNDPQPILDRIKQIIQEASNG